MFEAQFQSFDDRTDRGACAPRLAALREELTRRGLDGFIVPRADRYLNEYVPPSDERLAWLTGFTGSSGIAVVLADSAALFVDGRYQVQVREEVDSALFSIEHLVEQPPHAWIKANLPAGAKLGFSPWLHTVDGAERLAKACADAGGSPRRGRRKSDRCHLDRPARAAAWSRRAARSALCRRRRREQDRAATRRDARPERGYVDGVRSARGFVAVQYPRQRHPAHAGGACLRNGAEDGPADAFRRSAQARQRSPLPPGRDRRRAAERGVRARSCHARQRASQPAARSGRLPRCDRTARRRQRRHPGARRRPRSRR